MTNNTYHLKLFFCTCSLFYFHLYFLSEVENTATISHQFNHFTSSSAFSDAYSTLKLLGFGCQFVLFLFLFLLLFILGFGFLPVLFLIYLILPFTHQKLFSSQFCFLNSFKEREFSASYLMMIVCIDVFFFILSVLMQIGLNRNHHLVCVFLRH